MVPRISDAEMARRTEELVLRRIDTDELGLPALPTVPARCLEILSTPDFSVNEIARLVESDPLVAVRIVRLANSAGRATLEPARSIVQAVMRLGGDELRNFMIEVSARPIFESHNRAISALGRSLWTHSVAVALLARAVVRRIKGAHPEAAYLGGLLHDVGKPLLAAMLLDAERRLFNVQTRTWLPPATWLSLIGTVHRRVAIRLADVWRLPELVKKSIHGAEAYDARLVANPANAVRLANALAKTAGIHAGAPDEAGVTLEVTTGCRLFSFSERDVQALTDGLRERVDERLA